MVGREELEMDHPPSKEVEVSVDEDINSTENFDWQLNKKNMNEKCTFLYLNPHLADVTFNVGSKDSKEIPAHKFILCIGSPVFETMFHGSCKESAVGMVHIEVPDVEPDTFEALLAHLYLDKVSFNESIVFELLYCSKKYMLPFLTKECIIYLCSIVKSHNAILFMSKTRVYDCPEFWDTCWNVFSSNPDLCYQADTFINIDFATLHNVLSREKLKRSEAVVFDAALKWATHRLNAKGEIDEEEDAAILGSKKREELGTSFNYIYFEKMSAKEISKLVVPSCVLSSNELVNLFISEKLIDCKVKSPTWRSKEFSLCSINSIIRNADLTHTSSSLTFEVTSSVLMTGLTVLSSRGSDAAKVSIQKASLVCGSSSGNIQYNGKNMERCFKFPAPFRLDPKVQYTATIISPSSFSFYTSIQTQVSSSQFTITTLPSNYGFITRIKYDAYE
nr:BTB/POZ domain-containing protein 3-like [Lepeophtheirus salmonis]XP_040582105.1 BTB/POZ domain-containing protein 3-like [Lepeophtheirus salmonis]XP_040582107.1 BTB/POZ domain-containing protein 3-like [Lepeophtheirus salmonis]